MGVFEGPWKVEGIEKCLASGMMRGIGAVRAKNRVASALADRVKIQLSYEIGVAKQLWI